MAARDVFNSLKRLAVRCFPAGHKQSHWIPVTQEVILRSGLTRLILYKHTQNQGHCTTHKIPKVPLLALLWMTMASSWIQLMPRSGLLLHRGGWRHPVTESPPLGDNTPSRINLTSRDPSNSTQPESTSFPTHSDLDAPWFSTVCVLPAAVNAEPNSTCVLRGLQPDATHTGFGVMFANHLSFVVASQRSLFRHPSPTVPNPWTLIPCIQWVSACVVYVPFCHGWCIPV